MKVSLSVAKELRERFRIKRKIISSKKMKLVIEAEIANRSISGNTISNMALFEITRIIIDNLNASSNYYDRVLPRKYRAKSIGAI